MTAHMLWDYIAGKRFKNLDVVAIIVTVCAVTLAITVLAGIERRRSLERTLLMRIAVARLEERLLTTERIDLRTAAIRSVAAPRGSAKWFVRLQEGSAGRVGIAECTLRKDAGTAFCKIILPSGGVRLDSIQVSVPDFP